MCGCKVNNCASLYAGTVRPSGRVWDANGCLDIIRSFVMSLTDSSNVLNDLKALTTFFASYGSVFMLLTMSNCMRINV